MPTYDNEILEAALIGYEHQKKEIEAKIELLRAHLGGHAAQVREAPASGKRRPFSAATKKRMAAAQRRRWANKNAGEAETASEETTAPVKATRKAKRTPMSAEGRERIAAAQRRRWAASKKATKKKQAA
jgi:hypothetical protein